MLLAVSQDDLRAICTKLVEQAKAGSIPAAKEVLDRCLGRNVGLGDLTAWLDNIDRSAERAAEQASEKESSRPEALAEKISEDSGIDREAILSFVNKRSDRHDNYMTQLAVRLANASGVGYDDLAEFLNGQMDELRAKYEAQQARGGSVAPPA